MSTDEKQAVVARLKEHEVRIDELMKLIDEKKARGPMKVHARELMKVIKESLAADAKLGATARSAARFTDYERRYLVSRSDWSSLSDTGALELDTGRELVFRVVRRPRGHFAHAPYAASAIIGEVMIMLPRLQL